MNPIEGKLQFITHCFCAGADQKTAELRAASIRGELRWWFRVLGGWQGDERPLRDQELELFGGLEATGEKKPHASKFIVRITDEQVKKDCKNAEELGATPNNAMGYLLFPLRPEKDPQTKQIVNPNRRGFISPGGVFTLRLTPCGLAREPWESRLKALVTIFGELGALGFRARRCMGAMTFVDSTRPMGLREALNLFKTSNSMCIKYLEKQRDAGECVNKLGSFLKGWRSFGPKDHRNEDGPGFSYAKKDHDAGLLNAGDTTTYRPALGLPIIQQYSKDNNSRKNDWSKSKSENDKDKRFASPVLLRPYRDSANEFYPLVIFVDERKWQKGDVVYIRRVKCERDGRAFPVSLGLYEAMKNDPDLKDFSFS